MSHEVSRKVGIKASLEVLSLAIQPNQGILILFAHDLRYFGNFSQDEVVILFEEIRKMSDTVSLLVIDELVGHCRGSLHKAVDIIDEVHGFAVVYPVTLVHKQNRFEDCDTVLAFVLLQSQLDVLCASIELQELVIVEVFYDLLLHLFVVNHQQKYSDEI